MAATPATSPTGSTPNTMGPASATTSRGLDWDALASAGRALLARARRECVALGHVTVGTEHLLLALVEGSDELATELRQRGAAPSAVRAVALRHIPPSRGPGGEPPELGRDARRALSWALAHGRDHGLPVGTEVIFAGLLSHHFAAGAALERLEVRVDDLIEGILTLGQCGSATSMPGSADAVELAERGQRRCPPEPIL